MVTFLSHFTPSMMPEDVIERIFVQRKRLASRLVTLVRESVLGTAKHHTLIVGPRGIGKTHLASLVYHRVRGMPDLADKMRIAWLREEEWGIASFLDFVIRVLRALDEGYPEAGLAGRIESLFAHKAEHAEREAVALLDEFVGERTVFLITENLDQLFEGLDDVGQQQFRAYLQDRATWTILATAPGLFNGISLQSSPFYGFFRVRHLKELSVDEAVELLQRIAELSGREELATFVQTPVGRARIRAVHHLAGGNHRIYVIFSEFLTRETLDDLVEPFLTTMDHLTPYYQARMQALSPQMRKIVDYLCDVRHAVPVRDIAQRCFISQQTASSQLKILKERGFVRAFTVGRESHYELMEPLLRLSLEVKKQRGEPIRLFVDFLRFWYTKPELQRRLLTIHDSSVQDRQYLQHALEEWDSTLAVGEAPLADWATAYGARLAKRDFSGALEYAESLVRMRGTAMDHLGKATCLLYLGEFPLAATELETAHGLFPEEAILGVTLAIAYMGLARYEAALEAVDKAIAIDNTSSQAWTVRGRILIAVGRESEALLAHETAAKGDPTNLDRQIEYAQALSRLGRYEEALHTVSLHGEGGINPKVEEAKALILTASDRLEDAAKAFRGAIALEETSQRRAGLSNVLVALGQIDEAENDITRAAELDETDPVVWTSLGLIHTIRENPQAALDAYRKARELAPFSSDFQVLFGLALERVGRTQEAIEVYRTLLQTGIVHNGAHFRLAVALAANGHWDEALVALPNAVNHFRATYEGGATEELLAHWLMYRHPEHWSDDLAAIADTYALRDTLPLLSTAVARSQVWLISGQTDTAKARNWVASWASLSTKHSELEVGVRLLRAGVEYHVTRDPRHLLDLASEERSMVESIPGIRPLSDLT